MKKALVVLTILGALTLPVSEALAVCAVPVSMQHGLDSYLACDNSKPVAAFAYLAVPYSTFTALNVNSGTDQILEAAVVVPGQVQIRTDWSDPGVVGCPQDPAPAFTNHRVIISVQAADGTGALISLSGADPSQGYVVEMAHPFDAAGGAVLPIQCSSRNGRPMVTGLTTSAVNIHVDPPVINTDCDPDSVGVAGLGGSTCPDAFSNQGSVGHIFTSIQACGTRPVVSRSAWTETALTLDAAGNGSVPYTKPANTGKDCAIDPTCLCFFVGTTVTAGGAEGGSIAGFIQVAGELVAPPTAEGIRATTDAGKVKLSWSTSNEAGLAGFRLIAVSKAKGQFEIGSMIAAKGTPSSYTAEARMGDLKGSRSIIIRSVLTDGTTVDAAPVNF